LQDFVHRLKAKKQKTEDDRSNNSEQKLERPRRGKKVDYKGVQEYRHVVQHPQGSPKRMGRGRGTCGNDKGRAYHQEPPQEAKATRKKRGANGSVGNQQTAMDATSNELADTEVLAQLMKRRRQNKKISKVKKA
jgi:hypothetical protein